MRSLLPALSFAVLTIAAPAAAAEIPLLIAPVEGRVAQTEEDWAQMVPTVALSSPDESCDSPILYSQSVSVDGKTLYQEVCRWVTSNYIVAVDLQTGARRGVSDGSDLQVLRGGPNIGNILISKHKYHEGEEGGSYDPTYVVSPAGETLLMVPGTDGAEPEEALKAWLKATGSSTW